MCDKLHQEKILDDEKLRDLHHFQKFNNRILHSSLKEQEEVDKTEKRFAEEQEKLYNKYLEEEVSYRLTKKVEEE